MYLDCYTCICYKSLLINNDDDDDDDDDDGNVIITAEADDDDNSISFSQFQVEMLADCCPAKNPSLICL